MFIFKTLPPEVWNILVLETFLANAQVISFNTLREQHINFFEQRCGLTLNYFSFMVNILIQ